MVYESQCFGKIEKGISGFSFLQLHQQYMEEIKNEVYNNVKPRANSIPSGKPDIDLDTDRIMEGDLIRPGSRKFFANYGNVCGGVLISGQHVLTAAHCCKHHSS